MNHINIKSENNIHFIFCLDESGSMKEKDNGLKSRWE